MIQQKISFIIAFVLATYYPLKQQEKTGNGTSTTNGIVLIGNMASPRAAHTATLLKNGKVLICGGFSGGSTFYLGAEIYDPGRKTFKPAGNMTVARASHTATLLPDGKVLITGGYNGSYLSGTEIYDPRENSFTKGPLMTTARSGHTATLLPNGKILFAGGVGVNWSFLQSAEVYDMASSTFSSTGAMTTARESYTATLLNNGKVLITGGHKGRRSEIKIYANAELYDPQTGKFVLTGNLTKVHHKHDAVLMADGRVLVTGGSDERDSHGAYKTAELYDPVSATFKSAGSMNFSRYKHTGTSVRLTNGNILIAGGASHSELYNPKTNTFTTVAGSMSTDRLFSCATLLTDGMVLITGGYDESQKASSNAWVYNY